MHTESIEDTFFFFYSIVCRLQSYLLPLLVLAFEASVALEAEPAEGAACKTHSPSAPLSASGGASYS